MNFHLNAYESKGSGIVAKINDFIVFGFEVKRQMAPFAPQAAQGTLKGSTQVLNLFPVVYG